VGCTPLTGKESRGISCLDENHKLGNNLKVSVNFTLLLKVCSWFIISV